MTTKTDKPARPYSPPTLTVVGSMDSLASSLSGLGRQDGGRDLPADLCQVPEAVGRSLTLH